MFTAFESFCVDKEFVDVIGERIFIYLENDQYAEVEASELFPEYSCFDELKKAAAGSGDDLPLLILNTYKRVVNVGKKD